MLKFQDDYTTLITTFEDFILLVYTMVDDLYKQFVPPSVSERWNVTTAKMTDSEIIALGICSEVVGIDSEKAWKQKNGKFYLTGFKKVDIIFKEKTEFMEILP